MRFLKTNTATRVTVGPFLDKTDGITPETALTVTSCKVTLMVDGGGVPTLVVDASATASGGNNDMVHVTNDDAGFYDLEITAAQLNYVGRAMLAITDAANHCPVFHEFMILPANVYDALVGGSDKLEVDLTQIGGAAISTTTAQLGVNMVQVSGDAGAADNLEADYDGTGYNKVNSTIGTCTTNSDMRGTDSAALASVCTEARLAELDAANLPTDIASRASAADLATATGYIDTEVQAIYDIVAHATYGNAAINTKLGSPAGASVSADIAAIKNETAAILMDTAEIGAAGAGLTNIPWNVNWDAEVQSECEDALAAYDPPTKAEMDAAFTNIAGATFNTATDSLEALRNRGDAAWTTAAGFSTHSAADVWAVGARALTDKAGFSLSAAGIDAIHDEVIEGAYTLRQLIRIMAAVLAGKSAGGGTAEITFTGVDGTTTRVTATVDANGNRTAMTLSGA